MSGRGKKKKKEWLNFLISLSQNSPPGIQAGISSGKVCATETERSLFPPLVSSPSL